MPLVRDEAGNEQVVIGPALIGVVWGMGHDQRTEQSFLVQAIDTEFGKLHFFYSEEMAKDAYARMGEQIKALEEMRTGLITPPTKLIIPGNGHKDIKP